MSASPAALRRVAVHADTIAADLTLPATLPVAALIPSILDILGLTPAVAHYRLSQPGASPLPNSTTLAQNGIRDGTTLILSQHVWTPPARRGDDIAEAVSAALRTPARTAAAHRLTGALAAGSVTAVGALMLIRSAVCAGGHTETTAGVAAASGITALTAAAFAHRTFRDPIAGLTLNVVAFVCAGTAGLLAVPGAPGAPHALLAAMVAAPVAVLAVRLSPARAITMAALACSAVITAVAALAAVLTAAPTQVVGALTALTALGLIEAAPRMAIVLAGLTPRLENNDADDSVADRARHADRWLTSLLAAFSASAALGAMVAAITARRAIILAAVTATLLLLHARTPDRTRMLVCTVSGIITAVITFALAGIRFGYAGPWLIALTAVMVTVAMYLGFVAPALTFSPIVHRGVRWLECVALAAVMPLACWVCGAFSAVRGLGLPRM